MSLSDKDIQGQIKGNKKEKNVLELNSKEESLSKLHKQEFKYLAENLTEGITRYDKKLHHIYINSKGAQIGQMPPEKYIMKTDRELGMPEEPLASIETILKKVFNSSKSELLEFKLKISGELKYYRTHYIPEFKDYNNVESVLAIISDVTKEKEFEEQIKFHTDILAEVNDAIVAVDDINRVIYWNKGSEKLFGFELSEVDGKTLFDIIGYSWLSDKEKIHAIRQLKVMGEWNGENFCFKKNGEEITLKSYLKSFKDDAGNYIGTVYIMHDITKPVRIETTLEKNYKQLQEAQRIGHIGNWEWDIKNNVITLSDELYNIYGLDTNDSVFKYETILGMVHPEDKHIIDGFIENALKDHKPFNYEFRICRPDKNIRVISCQGEVTTDFAGHPIKIICVEQDITERKKIENSLEKAKNELEMRVEKRTRELKSANELLKIELEERKRAENELKKSEEKLKTLIEELKRSNEELQQFAYITSHDLQEPLRTITSFTQLIEKRYKDKLDEDADEFIEYIVDATERMQNLINDLLDYSRVTTRGKEFQLTNTNEILKDTISNLHAAIRENNAKVTYDKIPEIVADPGQFLQLFQNLIGNAIKFRKQDEPPKIHISCKKCEKSSEYLFSVQDNGIGMESQYVERIFIIFQRLHTREMYGGTGIGLAIAKRIVERHGGKIWVESEPEVGSTFYFTIPFKFTEQNLSKSI
ncbi:ATP-binding protein [Methanobacterium oryzae]|uniref:ATP-binding protein n=1 Tax=Methanobacterium oryzae TaxID=69540 RepID=UPI003D23E87E